MSDAPICADCGNPVDLAKPYWVVERWEGGKCVARGFVSNARCLIATAHSQRPRDANSVPITKGRVEPVIGEAVGDGLGRITNAGRLNAPRVSLRHTDRVAGERAARELAAELLATVDAARTRRLTLTELFARYERDVSAHKKGVQPAEDRRRIALWTAVLRDIRDVRAIDPPTLDRFVRDRRAGRILVLRDDGKPLKLMKRPSDTTIGGDLVFLNSVLNWACKVRTPDGSRLLADNPLRGYPIPQSKNPKRPIASYDRYLKVREHADQVDPQLLFGAFMDLIEALGWRVTATCELLASDVDLVSSPQAPHGRIRKRGEIDKEGVDMWVPLSLW